MQTETYEQEKILNNILRKAENIDHALNKIEGVVKKEIDFFIKNIFNMDTYVFTYPFDYITSLSLLSKQNNINAFINKIIKQKYGKLIIKIRIVKNIFDVNSTIVIQFNISELNKRRDAKITKLTRPTITKIVKFRSIEELRSFFINKYGKETLKHFKIRASKNTARIYYKTKVMRSSKLTKIQKELLSKFNITAFKLTRESYKNVTYFNF